MYFLEKGYEATNIRDICKEVNIKPSSLYFYYKSKQILFSGIYDEIWELKIQFLKDMNISDFKHEHKLKQLFNNIINYNSENILNEKFLLRYHLFPAEEIIGLIKDKYYYWSKIEDNILLGMISECKGDLFGDNSDLNEFLYLFKSYLYNLTVKMITDNIKPDVREQDMHWKKFWNSYTSEL